jgi:hypothetical protein
MKTRIRRTALLFALALATCAWAERESVSVYRVVAVGRIDRPAGFVVRPAIEERVNR